MKTRNFLVAVAYYLVIACMIVVFALLCVLFGHLIGDQVWVVVVFALDVCCCFFFLKSLRSLQEPYSEMGKLSKLMPLFTILCTTLVTVASISVSKKIPWVALNVILIPVGGVVLAIFASAAYGTKKSK